MKEFIKLNRLLPYLFAGVDILNLIHRRVGEDSITYIFTPRALSADRLGLNFSPSFNFGKRERFKNDLLGLNLPPEKGRYIYEKN